ncbi:MAG: DUF1573 domain-containing protein [Bacteroidetes bacterium]|nr:DUF1573 domain-containing protein [Bacteroidota bacterium]
MKILSTLTMATCLFVACNSGTENNGEHENTPSSTEQPSVDPGMVNNPMTSDQPEADPNDPTLPVLSFEKDMYEFPGTIEEGERVRHSFKFTNTGKSDLIISDASAPCGCTIPSYSKEPIPPGGEGKIDVEFNSTGKGGGRMEKSVRVTSNAIPKVTELRIVVNVNPKQAQ